MLTANSPLSDQTHASRPFGPKPDLRAVESHLNADAGLEWFTTGAGAITPVFHPLITSYSARVPYDVTRVAVRPSQSNPSSTMSVRINNGAYSTVGRRLASPALPLNPGNNTLEIKVVAANQVATKTYTLVVHRGASTANNALLSALTTPAGATSPAFSPAVNQYQAAVSYATASTTVTATTSDPSATLAVRLNFGAYAPLVSGAPSAALPLNIGANSVDIRVTARDGVTTATTTLLVTRDPVVTADAGLFSLSTSAGALNPVFNRGQTFYNLSVTGSVPDVTVNASPAQGGASMAVVINDGAFTALADGIYSPPFSLSPGVNKIEVSVTSSDGSHYRSHTLLITRTAATIDWISQRRLAPVAPPDGTSHNASLSADGRLVAFQSTIKTWILLTQMAG